MKVKPAGPNGRRAAEVHRVPVKALYHLARVYANLTPADSALVMEVFSPLGLQGTAGEDIQRFLAEHPDLARAVAAIAPAEEEPSWMPNVVADAVLNTFPLTDAGNAEALAYLFGDRLRYDHTHKRWLIWNDYRWLPDRDQMTMQVAVTTARSRLASAALEEEDHGRQRIARWALGSENHHRIKAMLLLAQSHRRLAVTADRLDTDPFLLGCENGALDLRTGDLVRDPDRLVTRSVGYRYDPTATCPRWEQFLREIFLDDKELIAFVKRAVGYTLTGDTREQVLFMCHGDGSNGKSTFLNVLHDLLGEYAYNVRFETFLSQKPESGSAPTPDLAHMYGKRLVTSSEVNERRRLNEARVKSLTGGDPITARDVHKTVFTFRPEFKIWLAVNKRPRIEEGGHAMWRRILLVPFLASIPEDQVDKSLAWRLKAEIPGILNWALEGCREWLEMGLAPPEIVRHATQEYRQEEDVVGQFVADRLRRRPGAFTSARAIFDAWLAWRVENGEDGHPPDTQRGLTIALKDRGLRYERRKVGGKAVRGFADVVLDSYKGVTQ